MMCAFSSCADWANTVSISCRGSDNQGCSLVESGSEGPLRHDNFWANSMWFFKVRACGALKIYILGCSWQMGRGFLDPISVILPSKLTTFLKTLTFFAPAARFTSKNSDFWSNFLDFQGALHYLGVTQIRHTRSAGKQGGGSMTNVNCSVCALSIDWNQ